MLPRLAALALTTALVWTLAGCTHKEKPVEHYRLTGVVVRLDSSAKTATIRHEAIRSDEGKVWMEAMTMDFPVRDPSEFARLKPDLSITARVNQKAGDLDFWIDEITPK